MPYARRACVVCGAIFQPEHPKRLGTFAVSHCVQCRRLAGFEGKAPEDRIRPEEQVMFPPLVQAVFDLETFSLDRGWGVLMVGSVLMHEGGTSKMYTIGLDESPAWPNVRSEDGWLAEQIISHLKRAHVVYAHNGRDYDIKWLRTLALKYGLEFPERKLVDPVQVARAKYRIGSNSLSNLADFLGLEEEKLHVSPDVWRKALFNNDRECWQTLRERCESDVRLLNNVAAKVVGNVGQIDYAGSAWR